MIKNRHDPRYIKVMNSAKWKHLRTDVIWRDGGLCQDCKADGRIRPGREVHHVVPIDSIHNDADFYRMAFDINNCVFLCRECHYKRHEELAKNDPRKKHENLKEKCREWLERFL